MVFSGYSEFWYKTEEVEIQLFRKRETKNDTDASVILDDESDEAKIEKCRNEQISLQKLLHSEPRKQIEDTDINTIHEKLFDEAERIQHLQLNFETFKNYNAPNYPVGLILMSYDGKLAFSFRTKRRNETVQIDIIRREFPFRFYDKKNDDGSELYCLECYVNKELANPEKLQEEFSIFLTSGKHLIDFIFDTVWPHIDESAKQKEQKDRESVPRENHPRYFLRARKHGV